MERQEERQELLPTYSQEEEASSATRNTIGFTSASTPSPVISKSFSVFFVIYLVAFVFSVVALFQPDYLRTAKEPILQTTVSFGFFQQCIHHKETLVCYPFPDNQCHLSLDNRNASLSFCQTWLVGRYAQIGAVLFGSVSLLLWFLMLFEWGRTYVSIASYWTTCLHGTFQIIVMSILIRLKDDPVFYRGTYGTCFTLILASWVLDALLIVISLTAFVVRKSTLESFSRIE